jgi:DNA polymerase V
MYDEITMNSSSLHPEVTKPSQHRGLIATRATDNPTYLPRPITSDAAKAGFPSPAQDFEEESLDINEYLVSNSTATFFVRVEGDSMTGAGIQPGDILVVDRSISFRDGHIVVAFVGGERLVKRLKFQGDHGYLVAENPGYPPLLVDEEHPATIWGVVTGRFAKVPV